MSILQSIQAQADQLAESEGKVARAILADTSLLEHYTITSLAQRAGTSTSAVLRFCHSMGYAGFKDFRFELISELRHTGTGAEDAFQRAAEGLAEAVRCLGELDRALVQELAAQIVRSSTVFCLGIHRSSLPARKLCMDIEDLGILAVPIADTVHATHLANLVGEQSCVIIFSESGSQTSYRAALDAGLAAQGSSWLVTSVPKPQLAAQVKQVVVLPSARRAGAGLVDEHPVAMAFVELLVLAIREQLA